MVSREQHDQSGQVLVQVALLLVVLLGFLALAVDAGNLYAQRRFMQNAADAGALAGAREICFGEPDNAYSQAVYYATQVNRAQSAIPNIQGYTVAVTATTPVKTYVASVIGIDTVPVRARAKAVCGAADRGLGDIWPVSINSTEWDSLGCDQPFTVWRGDNVEIDCNECNCNRVFPDGNGVSQIYVPDPTVLEQLTTFGAHMRIGPSQKGWLNLYDPPPPMPVPSCNYENCGAAGVACYLEQPHPGPITICDQVGNKSGADFSEPAKAAVRQHADLRSKLTTPLWNTDLASAICPALNPVIGNCGNNAPYPIVGFGCIEILGYSTKAYVKYNDVTNPGVCEDQLVVVFAKKLCSGCDSTQGGTSGAPPGGGILAVSLVE